ncbi:MAG: hypothetical protein ACRYGI_03400 [Janthinobacterium lividum]
MPAGFYSMPMSSCLVPVTERRRIAPAVILAIVLFNPDFGIAWGQTPSVSRPSSGGVSLTVPVEGGYDFHAVGPPSPASRLKNAPLPDPSTIPKVDNSLHDPNTGADTTAFGSAYSYPNPNFGTAAGENSVGNAASKSANVPQRTGFGIVVFEWGYPPKPMPKVPGEDLTAAPPPIPLMRLAVQANDEMVLDPKSLWVVQRAVQAYGRVGLIEITIEGPAGNPGCCARFPDLIRTELIRSGLGPGSRGMLVGHRIRLVLAVLPGSR